METAVTLAGIRVVDLSLLLPGPYCTHLMAMRGAHVTAVKPPQGDLLSLLPPEGIYYRVLHARKHMITLNLKEEKGRRALRELLETADVLVEGFRPGVMARLGFDYATLHPLLPRLIYCSISGYGQCGPRASLPGHDLNYLAANGLLEHLRREAGAPVLFPIPLADFVGGSLAAFQEIALALYQREKTGAGAYIDISMSDKVKELLLEPFIAQAQFRGEETAQLAFHRSPRYGIYQSADGDFFALACIEDKFWKTFCSAVNKPEWLSYPGSQTPWQEDDKLKSELDQLFRSQPASYWQAFVSKYEICVNKVMNYNNSVSRTDSKPI